MILFAIIYKWHDVNQEWPWSCYTPFVVCYSSSSHSTDHSHLLCMDVNRATIMISDTPTTTTQRAHFLKLSLAQSRHREWPEDRSCLCILASRHQLARWISCVSWFSSEACESRESLEFCDSLQLNQCVRSMSAVRWPLHVSPVPYVSLHCVCVCVCTATHCTCRLSVHVCFFHPSIVCRRTHTLAASKQQRQQQLQQRQRQVSFSVFG